MLKRGVLSLSFLLVLFVLFSCGEEIALSVDDLSVTVKVGETYQIEADTNDLVLYESSDESIVTISDSGLVSALKAGNAEVKVISKTDSTVFVTISVTVEDIIEITTTTNAYTIIVDESVEVTYEANDDVTLSSSDESIFTVEDNTVTGVADGQATLTITSNTDDTIVLEISITVRKTITLSVDQSDVELWVGKTEQITYTSNDDVEFTVSDDSIVSVSESGLITAIGNGLVTIDVISTYDQSVKETINVRVYNTAETLMITGNQMMNVNTSMTLSADIGPDDAYAYVTWSSSDETIATISETGELTALTLGNVTITVTSIYDENLTDEIIIEVVDYIAVDYTKSDGDTLTYMGLEYEFGINLFSTIGDGLSHVSEGSLMYVLDGTYQEDIDIDVANIIIDGTSEAIIDGLVQVLSDQVTIRNLNFTGQAQITNQANMSGFNFSDNTVSDITMNQNFLNLDTIFDVTIYNNVFTNTTGPAISIENYLGGLISVKNNTISDSSIGIRVIARDNYDAETKVQIDRNQISSVEIGLEIETLPLNDIQDRVRFNSVSDYTSLAAKANVDHKMDFTLNYWGAETPVYTDFENISTYELRGYYDEVANIYSESLYREGYIIKIIPDTNLVEMIIGDSYDITYETLPVEATVGSVKYITSDPDTLRIETSGALNPVRSGEATVILYISSNSSVNTSISVVISTTPGIELTPSTTMQNLLVGDSFTLDAMVFPQDISDEDVVFESNDPLVASINQEGVISSHSSGVVTFTAKLISDPTVSQTFTTEFFSSLDDSNLLDLLTKHQVNYSTPHEVTAYGIGYNYTVMTYESVSRYYFDDIQINQSKMVPVSSGIRPGEPMDPHPTGVTQYNPYNVYYVVVHDTANTSTGSGALAHANYLWNASQNGTELWASWHFSIDDKEIYQHLPETERGYHAGDGGSLAGTTWVNKYGNTYLGGGNRNGIGIETGVNDDSDLYRTWQRTAKLVAELLNRYNLPRDHMKYHNDFSGKDCPNTLRNAGLIPLFEELEDIEYIIQKDFSNATITLVSDNTEYVDNTGRVIKMPDRAMTVSYTVTVTFGGETSSRTFYTYLPGTIH